MNQYIITEEQKTPDNPLNYATMAILARIGKQAEFKEAWEKLENAERNYICGDIYNIVKSACSHPYQSERDIDEWCKVHSEVIKDIQTSAYREGYNDGKKSEQGKAMDKTRYNCKAYERMVERDYCEVIGGFLIPGTCPCSAWELRQAGEP